VWRIGGVEWNDTDAAQRKYTNKILFESHFIDQIGLARVRSRAWNKVNLNCV